MLLTNVNSYSRLDLHISHEVHHEKNQNKQEKVFSQNPQPTPSNKNQRIFHHATLAVLHTRARIPLKSDNKDYGEEESDIPKKKLAKYCEDARDSRTCLLNKIQCQIYALEATWKQNKGQPDFKKLAEIISSKNENAAGNCYEQAILAYDYLYDNFKDEDIPLDIISLKSPGNHNLVGVNQSKNSEGSYPQNFADWDEDAYIVDPWAKIACRAQNYPEEWTNKMHKWATRGLKINEDSPLKKEWFNSINEHEKISRLNAFPVK
jgi:hypothetical protein